MSTYRAAKLAARGVVATASLLVMTGCGAGTNSAEELIDAKADVATLGRDIAIWFVDNEEIPTVSIDGNLYSVEGVTSEVHVEGAVVTSVINSWSDWCVTVSNASGSVAASYSAQRSLEEGATCG